MVQHREIPKQPACPVLDAADEEQLTRLCFSQNAMETADLIFVFGNNVQHEEQARLAGFLCQRHPEAVLVLTGGAPNYSESLGDSRELMAESDALHQLLQRSVNLSNRKLFIERMSQNTRENVAFAAEYISATNPRSLVYLSQSFALGRSAMTIRAVLPEIAMIGSLGMERYVDGELLTSVTWTRSAKLRQVVWGEFLRIVTYSARGDIDPGSCSKTIEALAAKYID
jgi:uncharacterized SAM-binding protein YcdF (DUF218 family)